MLALAAEAAAAMVHICNPAFDLLTHGPVLAVRVREPSPELIGEIVRAAAELHAARGEKIVLVPIIGVDSTPPDAQTRELGKSIFDELFAHVCELRIVHPGEGLRLTILRSVTTTMTLVAGMRGHPFFADKTVPAMLSALAQRHSVEVEALTDRLLEAGMLSREELG